MQNTIIKIFTFTSMLIFTCATQAQYTDYIGAGHWDGTMTATESSAIFDQISHGAISTVNGSGLVGGTTHSTDHLDAWHTELNNHAITHTAPSGTQCYEWLAYDFGQTYNLGTMWVWNMNQWNHSSAGLSDVTIEYSTDGINWNTLGNFVWPRSAPDIGLETAGYAGFQGPDFGGVEARYVVVAAQNNYGSPYFGLSEVRFNVLPPTTEYIGAGNWDETMTATESSDIDGVHGAINTVNGSGLVNGKHSIAHEDTWHSDWNYSHAIIRTAPSGTTCHEWLAYDFGRTYELGTMWIWNMNQLNNSHAGPTAVTIDYSTNGTDWTTLGTFTWPSSAAAPGLETADYEGFAGPDFDGVSARYVVIACQSSPHPDLYGLSEVRFDLAESCAAGVYIDGDLNKDCYVNLEDFAMLMQDWLKCSDPQNAECTVFP
jgi:hypothetical protein